MFLFTSKVITQNGYTAQCSVLVMTSVKEIKFIVKQLFGSDTVSSSASYSVNINSKKTISALVDITEKQPTEKLEWISSNPEIASVESSSGTWEVVEVKKNWLKKDKYYATSAVITGNKVGTTTITVKRYDGRILGTVKVTVTKKVNVTLPTHSRGGEGYFSDWSGEIEAGAKSVTISTTSQLSNAWRDRRITFTYSGNGSHTWEDYLDGKFGNDPSESSTETVNLNGGTNWRISIYMSTGLGTGVGSLDVSGKVSGSLTFYY